MSFNVERLDENLPYGAIVTALDPADIAVPEIREALYELWINQGLLIFRDIPGGPQTQMALSRVFGAPEPHPMRNPDAKGDTPELADLFYRPDDGDIVRLDGELKGAYLPWHFDMVYLPRINRGGILRAITRAEHGGETGFLDGIALYEALPASLKAQLDGLYVTYLFDPDMNNRRYGREPGFFQERISSRSKLAAERMRLPPVAHPLVFTQAETGRKVLNFSPWFATGIEGMPQAAADEILGQIGAQYIDNKAAYFHRWAGDDMVLWDNWRMRHCARGVPVDEFRHVQRTTILGDYALGRIAQRAPAAQPA